MSKRLRNIIISLVVVGILVGGLFALKYLLPEKDDDNGDLEDPTIYLVDKTADMVEQIQVKNRFDEYVINRIGENEWIIPELKDKVPPYENGYTFATGDVAKIDSVKRVNSDPTEQDLKEYGLDDPTAVIKVKYTDNSTFGMKVGNVAPGNTGNYIQVEGEKEVHICTTIRESYLLGSKGKFVDINLTPTLNPEDFAQIERIVLAGTIREQPILLEKNPESVAADYQQYGMDEFLIAQPKLMNIEYDKLSTILNGLNNILASDVTKVFPTAAEIREYELEKPFSTISMAYKGAVYTIYIGKEEGDYYYCMRTDIPVIYKTPKSSFPFAEYKLYDIASKTLFMTHIDNIKSIELKGSTVNRKFDLTGEGQEMEVKSEGKLINLNEFQKFYQVIIATQALEPAEKPSNTKSRLTITIEYKKTDKKDIIEFIPIGDGMRSAFVKNGVGQYSVVTSYVDKIASDANKVYNGDPITVTY